MDDLIRKQTVLNMLDDMQFERYHTHAELDLFTQIYDAIYKLQPVDAVEVVRCKNCINSDWYKTIEGKRLCYCMVHGNHGHKETDFCSYGINESVLEDETAEKRKTDG